VDEQEWLTGDDPARMLEFLRGKASDRKLRLFACACCRQVWDQLSDPRSRKALEVAERYADGEATDDERRQANQAATIVASFVPETETQRYAASFDCVSAAFVPLSISINCILSEPLAIPASLQAALLRDLVGNPFRPISVETTPGSWAVSTVKGTGELTYQQRTNSTVLAIARRAYDEHCPADSLAILADALEDAGCTSEDLLRHLRGQERCRVCRADGNLCQFCWSAGWQSLSGPHARGCWAVDLVLGKD
jgi:hypothetical protein